MKVLYNIMLPHADEIQLLCDAKSEFGERYFG